MARMRRIIRKAEDDLRTLTESAAIIMARDGFIPSKIRGDKRLMGNIIEAVQEGEESVSGFELMFEDYRDAVGIYEFLTENEIMLEGEVMLTRNSVIFSDSVLEDKPEVLEGILYHLRDSVTEDSIEDYEDSVYDIQEAKKGGLRVVGAGREKIIGNPYRNSMGEFASTSELSKKKKGSWTNSGKKKKLGGVKKRKDGGKSLSFKKTADPCGREARRQGKNIRCWDGATIREALASYSNALSRKIKNEEYSPDEVSVILELRRNYGSY